MENLGKSVWEKYEIRKEAMDNMGQGKGELEEIKKEEREREGGKGGR